MQLKQIVELTSRRRIISFVWVTFLYIFLLQYQQFPSRDKNFSEITITMHYTMHKLTQRWHKMDTKLDSARLEYDLYLAVWAKVLAFLSIEQSSFMMNGSDGYLSIAKNMSSVITYSSGLE